MGLCRCLSNTDTNLKRYKYTYAVGENAADEVKDRSWREPVSPSCIMFRDVVLVLVHASQTAEKKQQKNTFSNASAHWHDMQNPSCPNAPAEFFHQDISPPGIKPEPNRNTFLFFSCSVSLKVFMQRCCV